MLGMWVAIHLGGAAVAQDVDENLWLEDVTDDAALAWAKQQSGLTLKDLGKGKAFKGLKGRIQGILDSDDKIPYVGARGDALYNFWQDAAHPARHSRSPAPAASPRPPSVRVACDPSCSFLMSLPISRDGQRS